VLPNEKHESSTRWRAAQKGGPTGCTTGRASGLAGCTVSWAALLQPARPFSAARRTAFLCSLPAHPSVFCAARPGLTVVSKNAQRANMCYLQVGLLLV